MGLTQTLRDVVWAAQRRLSKRATAERTSPLPPVPRRPSVKPVLPARDMAASIAYYRAFGFEVDSYDEGYAWVKTDGWEIFHLVSAPDAAERGVAGGAYVHVEDAARWHAAMTAANPEAQVGGVADTPWSMREFAVTDPSGNWVRFGQNL